MTCEPPANSRKWACELPSYSPLFPCLLPFEPPSDSVCALPPYPPGSSQPLPVRQGCAVIGHIESPWLSAKAPFGVGCPRCAVSFAVPVLTGHATAGPRAVRRSVPGRHTQRRPCLVPCSDGARHGNAPVRSRRIAWVRTLESTLRLTAQTFAFTASSIARSTSYFSSILFTQHRADARVYRAILKYSGDFFCSLATVERMPCSGSAKSLIRKRFFQLPPSERVAPARSGWLGPGCGKATHVQGVVCSAYFMAVVDRGARRTGESKLPVSAFSTGAERAHGSRCAEALVGISEARPGDGDSSRGFS
jgi:hypothetical protein